MLLIAGIPFVLSALGIVALFAVKRWELKNDRVLAPAWRERVDAQALEAKNLLSHGGSSLGKLPPLMLVIGRYFVHEAALSAASLASFLEKQAHKLADMVSHKHRFERRETQSDFLRKVSDHKNGTSEVAQPEVKQA